MCYIYFFVFTYDKNLTRSVAKRNFGTCGDLREKEIALGKPNVLSAHKINLPQLSKKMYLKMNRNIKPL